MEDKWGRIFNSFKLVSVRVRSSNLNCPTTRVWNHITHEGKKSQPEYWAIYISLPSKASVSLIGSL